MPLALKEQDYAILAVPEYLNQYLNWHQDGEVDKEGKLTRDPLTVKGLVTPLDHYRYANEGTPER